MTLSELMWFVGQVNSQRWRFHYGRMATTDRLRGMIVNPIPKELPAVSGLVSRLRVFRRNLNQLVIP